MKMTAFFQIFVGILCLITTCFVSGQNPELDLITIMERRISRIQESYYNPQLAQRLMMELREDGTWSDVDYTTGCEARWV